MANLTTGRSHQYCVSGTGGFIAVTLVWHDYPAALAAATTLVNDLDLTVRASGLNGFPLYVSIKMREVMGSPRYTLKTSESLVLLYADRAVHPKQIS